MNLRDGNHEYWGTLLFHWLNEFNSKGKPTLGASTFAWNDSSSHNLINMSLAQDLGRSRGGAWALVFRLNWGLKGGKKFGRGWGGGLGDSAHSLSQVLDDQAPMPPPHPLIWRPGSATTRPYPAFLNGFLQLTLSTPYHYYGKHEWHQMDCWITFSWKHRILR